jgi:hypothetical protein
VNLAATYRDRANASRLAGLVSYIGDNAFAGTAITSVELPNTMINLGAGAFMNCKNLTSFKSNPTLTGIGMNEFSGCTSLTSVTLSVNTLSIPEGAFEGCVSLGQLTIPSFNPSTYTLPIGATTPTGVIGANALRACVSLTSIVIPDDVTSIGESAFEGCNKLYDVTIGSGVTSVGNKAFKNCFGNGYGKFNDFVDKATKKRGYVNPVVFPNALNSFGDEVFAGCSYLKNVSVNSLTYIPNGTFKDCYTLWTVSFSHATMFGNDAFAGCNSLTEVTIARNASPTGIYHDFDKTYEETYNKQAGFYKFNNSKKVKKWELIG